MIEPVTLFSVIAGVTNLATRLTIDLTRLTVTLKNVPDQITQVCNEMVSLNTTLSTLQQRFNPTESGYTEEQLVCLETVITSTKETLIQLAKLSNACETTGKKKPGVTGIWKKMNWTLNESEIASYRSGLVGYTAMLNLLTATLADQRGANIEAMVTKTNEMLQTLVERRNRISMMSAETMETMNPKTVQNPKVPPKLPLKGRKRSSSVASQIVDHRGRKYSESTQSRSRSVAPSVSRGGSSTGVPADIRDLRGVEINHPYQSHSRDNWRSRSASTSRLPLPSSTPPPPLPAAASCLHLDMPNRQTAGANRGLPSPPPEYTELAPGMLDDVSSETRSQRQIIRTARSPAPPSSRSASSTRSASSRPFYRRALSSTSTRTPDSEPTAIQLTRVASRVPVIPPTPALPARGKLDGHKLEFAGKWTIKEIRINDSFMGSGVLFLKKDEPSKRVLVNLRLDSSKDTRLSYRWIESSSATRTKPSSMFTGPSYVLRSLVRADDYSGIATGKTSVKLEDIDYLAGQRSLMIAINLIQQSPPDWLVDTKPQSVPMPYNNGIHAPAPISPPTGTVRNFFRSIRAPSESNYSEPYPSPGSSHRGFSNNFSRPTLQHQYGVYSNVTAPPTPPDSPSEASLGGRSRRPSFGSSVGTVDSRVAGPGYENSHPIPRNHREARPRTTDPIRCSNPQTRCEFSGEQPSAPPKRGRQRTRRGPGSWFSFARS
ncbi:hypothetical protein TWF730_010438 [Orbilia blumenaviensis]|uniref:Fungal N-terminal domain-containing protein n=1 Tax=Orbilia blumenaviensis TaxID=1796055 RepID=A0AAV9UN94_9PEZI